MSQQITKLAPLTDLVKMEFDENYTRELVTLQNKPYSSTSGAALTVSAPMGQPIRAGNDAGKSIFALAGAEGNVTGLLLRRQPITALAYSANETFQPVLVRGPAIVSDLGLPINDVAGGTFTQATLQARLVALGIVVRTGPTIIEDASVDPNA